ncbi:MAG: lipopolysaccharide assembly protein LapB [Burkholderiaceae bacterium]
MEFENWWLLAAPILFALGWIASRIDLREVVQESKRLPRSYFNGLNFLLNDQPDRAIEAFVEVVSLDPETIELHFALGSLFRRRGETDRAIRLHRNLLERPDLPPQYRDQALFALAQDYLKAGLLDRAESAFVSLSGTPFEGQAQGFLADLYQMERSWTKAIDAATAHAKATGAPLPRSVAHFWCELAADAMAKGDLAAARAALRSARQVDDRLVRVLQMEVALAQAEGRDEEALQMIDLAVQTQPAFAAQLVAPLHEFAKRRGDAAAEQQRLSQWFAAAPSEALAGAISQHLAKHADPAAAQQFSRDAFAKLPGLASAAGLTQSLAPQSPDMAALAGVLGAEAARQQQYICANCGFKARQFYWQCPGCKRWETLPYSASARAG